MSIVTDEKATMTATEIILIRIGKVERAVRTETVIGIKADFTEIEKEGEIEKEIDINPEEDQEAVIRDGKEKKEKIVNEIDIGMMIETVIGIGFTEWF